MNHIHVYKLIDPKTGNIRYIGKTKNPLFKRLSAHMDCSSDNVGLNIWIKSLKESGMKPIIELIEITGEHNWCIREQYWIDKFFNDGEKLFNVPLDKNNPFYVLREYQKVLIRCNYSEHTQKNYCSNFLSFLLAFKHKKYYDVSHSDITNYLESLVETKNISPSYQNSIINSVKFWREKVLNAKRETYFIRRPKKEYPIRPHLTINQVQQILFSFENLKHRTAFTLMYSCGLRSSEVVSVIKSNINFEEGQLLLKQAKGKKDRIVILGFETLALIDRYIKEYNPEYWLFEGQYQDEHWSQKSLHVLFKKAIIKLGFDKDLHPHDLRGSSFTHLMDNGFKIENAAKMAGHNSIATMAKFYYHYNNSTIKEQLFSAQNKISQKINNRALLENKSLQNQTLIK